MDRATMTDFTTTTTTTSATITTTNTTTARRNPATITAPHEFPVLPASASALLKQNTISVHAPSKIQSVVDEQRRRNFQSLVRRYMSQLLYGCQREDCDTPTCYTYRKRLPRNSSASRRLTLLSARIIACSLASQDDPLGALCPGKPVVPTLAPIGTGKSGGVRFTDQLDDDEKENRPEGDDERGRRKKVVQQGEVSVVTDKGLKDPRSFTQQLFNTMALKMVEWISLPSLPPTFSSQDTDPAAPPSPQEPPKIKFPINPMDVMDTGRLNRDSEPVSQIRHQEILQQQPRKRGPSLKEVTPTPHSNIAKTKLTTPVSAFTIPPSHNRHHHPWKATTVLQVTPSRGDRNTQTPWEPEAVAPPQSLKLLDPEICKALMDMCTHTKASLEQKDAKQFAKQSIFYVFSTPAAVLASFGSIGNSESVDFDPGSINKALDALYARSWGEENVKRGMWAGLANVFAKPGKGLSDKDIAGMIVLAIHVVARGLVKDEEVFRIVTKMRATARLTSGIDVLPDVGLDDELAERLMRRVLRAISFRRSRPDDNTILHIRQYLRRYERLLHEEREIQIVNELQGKADHIYRVGGGVGLARCVLEWTRAIFMRNWDGMEIVKRDSLPGVCIKTFEFLFSDFESFGLSREIFETKTVGERINAYVWPVDWYNRLMPSCHGDLHLLDSPYLLQVSHCVTFFRAINFDIMKRAYESVITSMRMATQMAELTKGGDPRLKAKFEGSLRIYFVLVVRRTNLMEDALNQLMHREHRELMRPLKVRFAEGEEGVDQGGVQQEFFSLLIKDILKPDYGMFVTDDRTRMSWFWEGSLEGAQKFELVGLVVGLAVYNGITLPVNFPKALYIKLLGGTPTLNDIDDNWPELAKGLQALLKWEDGDVGDVFVRTYEYSYPLFGCVRYINMLDAKENGPEFLPQPIPMMKGKMKRRVEAKRPGPPLGAAVNWLPPFVEQSDEWLGSLDHLETLDNEELETEQAERLERLRSGTMRYTVTYHDLNAPGSENGEGSGSGRAGEETKVVSEKDGSDSGTSSDQYKDSESEKSWQTMGDDDDDDVSIPAQIKLPPDDGEDWDDRSTTYSPTGSMYGELSGTFGDPAPSAETTPTLPVETTPALPVSPHPEVPTNRITFDDAHRIPSSPPSLAPSTPAALSFSPEDSDSSLPPAEAPLVTNANRHAFVEDYISWLTDRSIRRQYTAFARGFFAVNTPRTLSLFSPTSLQAVVEGDSNTTIDIAQLEAVCKYEDGYYAGHRVIRDFWTVVRGFPEEKRRRLLEFVTSSARVPVGGLGNVMFYVVRNGEDSERLPSSLTCFGRLLLPEYSSRRKLKVKLNLALENTMGFGNP